MLYNYKMGNTFSNSYKRTDTIMTRMHHYIYCNKFTDYRMEIKNTFMFNSRNAAIMSDTKKLSLEDKITDYKSFKNHMIYIF